MRMSLSTLAVCLLLSPLAGHAQAPAARAAAAPAAPPPATALNGFDAVVAETLRQWNVPGVAIAVVRDGEVVLSRGYGVRSPTAGAPMTKDTLFPIASVTKAFVSFGAGLLVDEGKMSFDAPVVTYLPGLALRDPAVTQGLTLGDMLSHRSGLPRHDRVWYRNRTLTRDGLVARMAYLEPTAPLRGRYQYNNNMFVLSGLAIERVAGQPWEAFTEARIFRPLGMRRTTLDGDRALADPDRIEGTVVRLGQRVNVPMFANEPLMNPAGGIFSTADDLARWMNVHLSGGRHEGRQIIQPSTLAAMHQSQMLVGETPTHPEVIPIGYGLAWRTEIYRGRPTVQHGGALPGIATLVTLVPGQRIGVAVLANQSGAELPRALTRTLLDRFLALEPIDWLGPALARKTASEASDVAGRQNKGGTRAPGTQPSHPLAEFAGTYAHPGYGPITIEANGTQLVGRYNDDSSPLAHWHYNVFDATSEDVDNLWLDSRLQFVSDFHGRVSGLQIVMEPAVPPVLFARQPEAQLSDPEHLRTLSGTYQLGGTRVVVSLSGRRLMIAAGGGQPVPLLPGLGGEFVHSQAQGTSVGFRQGPDGRAASLVLTNASGQFEAKRVE
jgi:CubicO group peptidase (beta-lactamase class C family)